MEVPHIELVVQRTAEAHANKVRCKEYQHHLIHREVLSRDFPFARFFKKLKYAFSWPLPAAESEEQQSEKVSSQQHQVEVAIQEEPLWQEAPVHRPLEHELTAEIEGPAHIADRIVQKERKAQEKLYGCTK